MHTARPGSVLTWYARLAGRHLLAHASRINRSGEAWISELSGQHHETRMVQHRFHMGGTNSRSRDRSTS